MSEFIAVCKNHKTIVRASPDGIINIIQERENEVPVIYFDAKQAGSVIKAIRDCVNQIKQDAKK